MFELITENKDFLELESVMKLKYQLFTRRGRIESELFLQEGQGKMKDKDIARYTRFTLPKGNTDWDLLKNMSEETITEAAASDDENPCWTEEMLEQATLQMPQRKISVHMYIDEDIVNWFKLKGKGYQTRINSVLKSYIHKH
jgi:uncharacterized protein (DUF4415 family)